MTAGLDRQLRDRLGLLGLYVAMLINVLVGCSPRSTSSRATGAGHHRPGAAGPARSSSGHQEVPGAHGEDAEMGPEMEKLKKKYADDKDSLAKAQMQFYKEQGMTRSSASADVLADADLDRALERAAEHVRAAARALPLRLHLDQDLSKPDYLVHFSQPIPLLFGMHMSDLTSCPLTGGSVLPADQDAAQAGVMTPEQAQQQKMMT